MREALDTFLADDLPLLDPVVMHARTDYGWRGLTEVGEVYEVKSNAPEIPSEIIVAAHGRPIGRREIRNDWTVDIDAYLKHFNLVVSNYKANCLERALLESAATLKVAPTLRAKFNRAMVLLAAGQWAEGLAQYWQCEQHAPFIRPQARQALDLGLRPWHGEKLQGKRLLLLHAHGFGDTLMMLRYVPQLRDSGINAVMVVPPPLRRLAEQCGPVIEQDEIKPDDCFCPILHLLHLLGVESGLVDGRPYLSAERKTSVERRRIGIAWSIGKPTDGDYPREIPLHELVAACGLAEIHSVQTQGADDARRLGVHVHEFVDFADCAALMMTMDEIVSVDTAALHLAGAIGHPKVFGLLSHWHSWRWVAPFYANIRLCRQSEPGNWSSALAQIHQR